MVKLLLRLYHMPGAETYAKKGLKKSITVYVNKKTYVGLVKRARRNEWSLQTLVRKILEKAAVVVDGETSV